jgi:outer membrane protein W
MLIALLAAAAVTTTPTWDKPGEPVLSKGTMGVEFMLPGGASPNVNFTYFMNDGMAMVVQFGLNATLSPSGVPVLFNVGGGVRLYQLRRDRVAVFLEPTVTLARVGAATPTGDATVQLIFAGGLGVQYFFTDRFAVGGIMGVAFSIGNLGGPTGSSAIINLSTGNSGLFASYHF